MVTFPSGRLRGTVAVPGDKSISHRALISGVRCDAALDVTNLNPGRDVIATQQALEALGIRIERRGEAAVVHPGPLRPPRVALDCMNSGSTVRMLLGACAGAPCAAAFDGDESLRRRPMEPVAAQLRAFGARIETSSGTLPLRLLGRAAVETRRFILLAPSAQVKSALLFAGLFAGVPVRVEGDRGSRDHTERLLAYLGAGIVCDDRSAALEVPTLHSRPIEVAGDFSAAAFFITAAAIAPESAILIRGVGVNPTRTGLLEALWQMGAAIELRNQRTVCGESIADISVEHRPLKATAIDAALALRAIDEIPLLAIAAAFATGTTTIAGVSALRGKESDRLAAIERLLEAVGIPIASLPQRIAISGGTPAGTGTAVRTEGDHRIIMGAAVLACGAGPLAVDDDAAVDVSFPGFGAALAGLRA